MQVSASTFCSDCNMSLNSWSTESGSKPKTFGMGLKSACVLEYGCSLWASSVWDYVVSNFRFH